MLGAHALRHQIQVVNPYRETSMETEQDSPGGLEKLGLGMWSGWSFGWWAGQNMLHAWYIHMFKTCLATGVIHLKQLISLHQGIWFLKVGPQWTEGSIPQNSPIRSVRLR